MSYKIISPIPVVEGGTGAQTFSSYGVVCGGLATTDPLETIATGGVGYLLMANGAGKPTFETLATVINASTAIVPVIHGGTGRNAITLHNLIIGNGNAAITLLPPHATAGIPLVSAGAAADPVYGTVVVAGGGTGATALTDHGVLVGSGGNPVTALAVGLTGEALLGTTGADPVFGIITSGIVSLDTTNFNNVLSAADTTVQLALDTIDDFGSGTGAQTVHLYDGAGVKTVTLGSTNTTSTTTIEGGTSINIGTNNAASAAINIGTDSAVAARTITIGQPSTNTGVNITSGSGGIKLESSNGGVINIGSNSLALTYKFGTGAGNKTVNIGSSTGTSTTTVDCGTGGASFGISANAHTTTIGSINTTSDTIIQSGTNGIDITATNGPITAISGTGQIDISTDAAATTVNIASGAAVKTVTMGSTNTTSQLVLQSGTNGININSHDGGLVINSGTGALSISNDASATTVNIATGGAAKTTALGSTNTTSATTINSGSGGVTMTGVASVAVANKHYVTINSATGALGSEVASLGGALVLLGTQTASDSASIIFNNAYITSSYSNYFIIFYNVCAAAETEPNLTLVLSTDNGATYITTNYRSGAKNIYYYGTTWASKETTSAVILASLISSSYTASGHAYLYGLQDVIVKNGNGMATVDSSAFRFNALVWTNSGTAAVNCIKILMETGNITTGSFSLYGIAK